MECTTISRVPFPYHCPFSPYRLAKGDLKAPVPNHLASITNISRLVIFHRRLRIGWCVYTSAACRCTWERKEVTISIVNGRRQISRPTIARRAVRESERIINFTTRRTTQLDTETRTADITSSLVLAAGRYVTRRAASSTTHSRSQTLFIHSQMLFTSH